MSDRIKLGDRTFKPDAGGLQVKPFDRRNPVTEFGFRFLAKRPLCVEDSQKLRRITYSIGIHVALIGFCVAIKGGMGFLVA